MIICDTMRAVLLALLGILVVVHLASWPVALIVSMIEGGAQAIFNPAAAAALPGIVPDGQLEEACRRCRGPELRCPPGQPGARRGALRAGPGRPVPG